MTTPESVGGLPPAFQTDVLELSEEEKWDRMQMSFFDMRDFLETGRLETREDAINKTAQEWFDPETQSYQRAWLLIPYRLTFEDRPGAQDILTASLETARSLAPRLEQLFAARVASVKFLIAWGLFCEAASFVNAVYLTEKDDFGQERAKRKGADAWSRKRQKVWVAKLLCQQMDISRSRQQAERDVAKAIRLFIEKSVFPVGYDKDWFGKILGEDNQLSSTYSQRHLSEEKARELSSSLTGDIPPTICVPST